MRTFVVTRNIGGDPIPTYIEAKDVGKDLNSKSYRKQFSRYKKALDNLIITDYVCFQFFRAGALVYEVRPTPITLVDTARTFCLWLAEITNPRYH